MTQGRTEYDPWLTEDLREAALDVPHGEGSGAARAERSQVQGRRSVCIVVLAQGDGSFEWQRNWLGLARVGCGGACETEDPSLTQEPAIDRVHRRVQVSCPRAFAAARGRSVWMEGG
jgi:hypothetical protein